MIVIWSPEAKESLKIMYRSVVVNNLNKIVYYIEGDVVHIATLWDTRREPKSLIEDLEESE